MINKITKFNLDGCDHEVSFVETVNVTPGVSCDVYQFPDDPAKDLAIVTIDPGHKTPLQKVLNGDKTIEGYISGRGKFTLTNSADNTKVYSMNGEPFSISVKIGNIMQWEADLDSNLVVYEICYPPYKDGRFENQ